MFNFIKRNIFIGLIILISLSFFYKTFLYSLIPIPADTIVGLYHPFRDKYAKDYPNGIPYKNFLITDPVRQQYPWKNLSIGLESEKQFPLWNPYEMAGKPLLANFQSGAFYPLNLLFFLKPFYIAWSIYIILGTFLSTLFAYLFIRNLGLKKPSSLLGALVFSFSGFSIVWLEWGNITHTILWLPLILLSVDKLLSNKKMLKWCFVLIISLSSSLFAGHLQLFFYVFSLSFFYFIFKWFESGKNMKKFIAFLACVFVFLLVTSLQWLPTLKFISQSARAIDQSNWLKDGWFIPWQNLIQFISPDFFGNPATLNYWGIFNYGEFVGYVGIFPLVLSLFALFFVRQSKVLFFGSVLFISLFFSYPTFFSKVPYILNVPLISTAQPTRLNFITDFSLAILSAIGMEQILKNRKGALYVLGVLALVVISLWVFVIKVPTSLILTKENLAIAKNNLIFPTLIFFLSFGSIFINFISKKVKRLEILWVFIIAISVLDLFRFGWKFTPFTNKEYLYPQTSLLSFVKSNIGNYRIMSVDPRIMAPNFYTIYKIPTVDGYDPLYLENYADIIVASERSESNINPPFGFDRIITPHNFESNIIDLLGVKYILSLTDLSSPKLTKVFQEGITQVYENKKVLPRTFFVEKSLNALSKKDTIDKIFKNKNALEKIAIVNSKSQNWSVGSASISKYAENNVVIKTDNRGLGFLVLTDSFYPSWHVKIDGQEVGIEEADLNFRGVIVPKGSHTVEFYITIL